MNDLMKISSALANSSLFKELQSSNDKLAGGSGGYNRISLKGGKFRQIIDGEQVNVSKDDTLPIIIIDAAPISKTYYEGQYDPENPAPPTCWSANAENPAPEVPADQVQSKSCKTCPMAVKGSGQGNSAACRYSQRLAVALEGDLSEVYQLSLPAKSLFGKPENGHMPMQAYAKHLKSHKVPHACLVTDMYFDEDSETPKVFFKPKRMLEEVELEKVITLRDSEEVQQLLELTVSEVESASRQPSDADVEETPPAAKASSPKAAKKSKPEPEVVEEDEEPIEEPVKAKSRKEKVVEEVDDELAGLIDEWD